nr:hypothetical protein [Tanacetum cinerariifolium]
MITSNIRSARMRVSSLFSLGTKAEHVGLSDIKAQGLVKPKTAKRRAAALSSWIPEQGIVGTGCLDMRLQSDYCKVQELEFDNKSEFKTNNDEEAGNLTAFKEFSLSNLEMQHQVNIVSDHDEKTSIVIYKGKHENQGELHIEGHVVEHERWITYDCLLCNQCRKIDYNEIKGTINSKICPDIVNA